MKRLNREECRDTVAEGREMCRLAWKFTWDNRWKMIIVALAAGLVGLKLHSYDAAAYRAFGWDRTVVWFELSRSLREWGRFMDVLFFAFALFGAYLLTDCKRFRRAALACLLAGIVSGITVNVFRAGTGRPRPSTELPDRFHGPTTKYKMQSFPSGHVAASTAGMTALAFAMPSLAVVALGSSASLAWSSVYTHAHHPTDIFFGLLLGLSIGVPFGAAARIMERRE
ncbi:MAG: phosphatase PAP2 family protein [Verrucomicrobia bacterium]|nr:phosphatase PAP2 family protein [Verrucomicrobiota bacterium]